MLAVRVQCPFCSKTLKLRQAPVPGRRLLCSGCNRSFLPAADVPLGPDEDPVAAKSMGSAPAPDWAMGASQPAPTPPPRTAKAPPPPPPPAITPATPRPSSAVVLQPIAPPTPTPANDHDAPTDTRRMLLVGGVAAGLLLLTGSTILALVLATRHDRKKNGTDPVARLDDRLQPRGGKEDPRTREQTNQEEPNRPRVRKDDEPAPPWRTNKQPPSQPPEVVENRPPSLPPDLQEQVNKAVDKGVEYLKSKQQANGGWDDGPQAHPLGMAALPALTLLECGVKADDPAIQKAANYVRENYKSAYGHTTYECSLALLFLDRLGDPSDKPIIRRLAMRLVGGQLPGGGWSYGVASLNDNEEHDLIEFLERTRPERKLEFVEPPKDGKLEPVVKGGKGLDAYYEALEAQKNEKKIGFAEVKRDQDKVKPLSPEEMKKAYAKVPGSARNSAAVTEAYNQAQTQPKAKIRQMMQGGGDNSNTQFATLALWAARRHDLPLERSLDAVGKRFRDSQGPQGTWGYHVAPPVGTPAMTGAGLLGLAVGHGSATDPDRKFKVKDAKIDNGLKALGQNVGKPMTDPRTKVKAKLNRHGAGTVNLYLLWTIERVGMLYDVQEFDGKDWYLWGVEVLVPIQDNNGSWHPTGFTYHGATRNLDTSFALLFLKRANLASDLTKRLEFVVDGKPGR